MANEEPLALTRIPNEYCGEHSDCEICKNRPWWLAEFKNVGVIKIGWRKRVIEINWQQTQVALNTAHLIGDNTTRSEFMVHAYGYADAINYLRLIVDDIRRLNRLK